MGQLDTDTAAAIMVFALLSVFMLVTGFAEWIWTEALYLLVRLGYLIRPYDMLADRRRWFWQPRQPCGSSLWVRWSRDE